MIVAIWRRTARMPDKFLPWEILGFSSCFLILVPIGFAHLSILFLFFNLAVAECFWFWLLGSVAVYLGRELLQNNTCQIENTCPTMLDYSESHVSPDSQNQMPYPLCKSLPESSHAPRQPESITLPDCHNHRFSRQPESNPSPIARIHRPLPIARIKWSAR